jgi:hypothetical protein
MAKRKVESQIDNLNLEHKNSKNKKLHLMKASNIELERFCLKLECFN